MGSCKGPLSEKPNNGLHGRLGSLPEWRLGVNFSSSASFTEQGKSRRPDGSRSRHCSACRCASCRGRPV